ncbi:hypothetical protein N5079_05575 [Planotetraspora sp. A-T 1434]|uniref:hypothetical protein n=1 Tax=Planotetraspora sp. A-T 1434 TaxID=2979219 RepID=UPI0021C24465|nr:hypothetical protein [Planotetraspora sp. A-T 1434]MCT9929689.1 hypothetical protein [Planotetraspora sp. A-T 1434]
MTEGNDMWQTAVLSFLAAVFGTNAVPHFVKGITKEPFPTPFGPSPVINLVAGWGMFCLAGLLFAAADVRHDPRLAAVAAAVGVLLMGLFHARIGAFGRR